MLHTDVTRFDESVNPDAWILVGDVRFRRDSMYMFCDSAHYFQKKNAFQAFGNVRMEQGDTLFLFGDYLDYDGDTNMARVRHNVRLIDNNTELTTDSLDFDRNENLGYFIEQGTLFDGESTLKSYYGEYDVDTKDAFFQYEVNLTHPDFKLLSDTLRPSGHVHSHLRYPHSWVWLTAAQIFGLLFASCQPEELIRKWHVKKTKKKVSESVAIRFLTSDLEQKVRFF